MNVDFIIIIIFMTILLYVVVKWEAHDSGISWKSYSDDESIPLRGTKMKDEDTTKVLYERLENILSYHEKFVIWRRCIIISIFLLTFVYIVYKMNNSLDTPNQIFIILFLFTAFLYFYFNFVNYHHNRKLKNNGIEIINKLKENCSK